MVLDTKELINYIFSLLDDVITKHAYFAELKKIVFANLTDDFEEISVSQEIFDKIPPEYYDVDVGEALLEFTAGELYVNIMKADSVYTIQVILNRENDLVSTLASLGDFSRIENIVMTFGGSKYEDFKVDIYFYEDNELIPSFVLGDDVYSFMKTFKLPVPLGTYFYHNMSKFLTIYNNYLEREYTPIDELLDQNDYYAFMPPFNLFKLKDYFKYHFKSEFDDSLLEVLFEIRGKVEFKNDISFLVDSILDKTGIVGRATMTYSLYQNILLYLLGYIDEIDARGFLIKEVNGYYTLYSIIIEQNIVQVMEKNITNEEAELLYRQNSFNSTIPELSNFFGTQPSRY